MIQKPETRKIILFQAVILSPLLLFGLIHIHRGFLLRDSIFERQFQEKREFLEKIALMAAADKIEGAYSDEVGCEGRVRCISPERGKEYERLFSIAGVEGFRVEKKEIIFWCPGPSAFVFKCFSRKPLPPPKNHEKQSLTKFYFNPFEHKQQYEVYYKPLGGNWYLWLSET